MLRTGGRARHVAITIRNYSFLCGVEGEGTLLVIAFVLGEVLMEFFENVPLPA